MKTFKEFLLEKLFKSGMFKKPRRPNSDIEDYQIFINPTTKELKNDDLIQARGFIDMKGNLYLLAEVETTMIHMDILELLSAVIPIKHATSFWHYSFNDVGGIAIIRDGSFSESNEAAMSGDYDLEIKNLKEAGPIRKKAQQKNKSLKFFIHYKNRIK